MGGSIAAGAVKAGVVDAGSVTIADPRADIVESLAQKGVVIGYSAENREALRGADLIIVAVKPWLMESVLGEISDVIDRSRQAVVSIAAGVTFSQLEAYLATAKFGGMGIYRVIPNTAISIGSSVTFVASHNTSTTQDSYVMELFKSLGEVFVIGEGEMTAATALASSGIAYAFKYIDAAMQGGATMGFDEQTALRIVVATVKGAVGMLETHGSMPQEEIDKVTTPGGITLKGLEAMEKAGFSQAVIDGLLATK